MNHSTTSGLPTENLRTTRLALTIPEAAELSAVSVSTIRRAITSGELKASRVGESAVRVRLIDLDSWLAAAAGSEERAVVAAEVSA